METLESWTQKLEEGCGIDVTLYLDHRRAFDTVPHKRLIDKAKGIGINGRLNQSIIYLRTQAASHNEIKYSKMKVFNRTVRPKALITALKKQTKKETETHRHT